MATPIHVVPYDPDWPRRFEEERRALAAIFSGTGAVIEHVGSTAVPGLSAKPIIDILVGLRALSDAEDRIEVLRGAGYEYDPAHEVQVPDRRYFRKPALPPRTHHLHCVVHGGSGWRQTIAFRDVLRSRPDVRAAYSALKRDLARSFGKGAYTERKAPFIEAVLAGEWDSTA